MGLKKAALAAGDGAAGQSLACTQQQLGLCLLYIIHWRG
jgi:hypothetical protein